MSKKKPVKVYGIYSKSDNRIVYVGQTTLTLKQRYNYHTCSKTLMGQAIKEKGKDAFYISLIKEVSEELVDDVELGLILEMGTLKPNGYNAVLASHRNGGIGREMWKNPEYREKQIKVMSQRMAEYHEQPGNTRKLLKNAWAATEEKRKDSEYNKNIALKVSKALKHKFENDPEYRTKLLERLQLAHEETRNNPEIVKGIRERKCQNVYVILHLNSQEKWETTNLQKFCLLHNLDSASMHRTRLDVRNNTPRTSHHKGFKIISVRKRTCESVDYMERV